MTTLERDPRAGRRCDAPYVAPDQPQRTITPDRWGLVVVAGLSIYMAQLDTTIVNVALPAIEADLGVGTSTTQWIVLGYLVPLIGLSLLAGRWLDTIGHRSALSIAVVGFAVASIVAGAAPNAVMLIAARAAQGAFGALLLSLAPVLAVSSVRPEARARALGVVGALAPLGAMSGPVIGGQLVDTLGWPWIFYTYVPVALVILMLGRAGLPMRGRLHLPSRSWLLEAGVLGTAAVTVLLATTLVVSARWTWAGLALAAPPLVVIWRRMEIARPIVALPATTAALGLVAGALADRFDHRRVALAGAVVIATAIALLAPLSDLWTPIDLAWRLALLGSGLGLFMTPASSLAMTIAPSHLLGVTASSTNLARYLGLALGPALASAAWAASGYRLGGMRTAIVTTLVISLIPIVALVRARGKDLDDSR